MTEAFAGQGIDWLLDWPPADASEFTGPRQSALGERRLDARAVSRGAHGLWFKGVIIMDEQSKLRDGYAEVGDQRLHYVEAGEGPLILLLHGFPEFWYGWRQQIEPLAAAGVRVVAPDLP